VDFLPLYLPNLTLFLPHINISFCFKKLISPAPELRSFCLYCFQSIHNSFAKVQPLLLTKMVDKFSPGSTRTALFKPFPDPISVQNQSPKPPTFLLNVHIPPVRNMRMTHRPKLHPKTLIPSYLAISMLNISCK